MKNPNLDSHGLLHAETLNERVAQIISQTKSKNDKRTLNDVLKLIQLSADAAESDLNGDEKTIAKLYEFLS